MRFASAAHWRALARTLRPTSRRLLWSPEMGLHGPFVVEPLCGYRVEGWRVVGGAYVALLTPIVGAPGPVTIWGPVWAAPWGELAALRAHLAEGERLRREARQHQEGAWRSHSLDVIAGRWAPHGRG